ncbi:MAG: hypothetical protein DYH12_13885 [Sorangiineae bacterium PRO1]|nr:hypothetical protein [Sorangiineae bacterium PRO1]
MSKTQWTPHELRRGAVIAGVDPRTFRAVLEGRRVRSTCEARVRDAIRQLEAEQGANGSDTPVHRRAG